MTVLFYLSYRHKFPLSLNVYFKQWIHIHLVVLALWYIVWEKKFLVHITRRNFSNLKLFHLFNTPTIRKWGSVIFFQKENSSSLHMLILYPKAVWVLQRGKRMNILDLVSHLWSEKVFYCLKVNMPNLKSNREVEFTRLLFHYLHKGNLGQMTYYSKALIKDV